MEKKTIGKMIAILRRENGMTQKELADQLYVSDKTISRWERDESTPDLALIPIIADLFGITTDELLRGEKKSVKSQSEDIHYSSEKQFQYLVDKNEKTYFICSLASIIVSLIGFMICIVFYHIEFGIMVLFGGFYFIVSLLIQLGSHNYFRIKCYEDDEYFKKIKQFNTKLLYKTVRVLSICGGLAIGGMFLQVFQLGFSPNPIFNILILLIDVGIGRLISYALISFYVNKYIIKDSSYYVKKGQ